MKDEWIVIEIDNSNYDDPFNIISFDNYEEAKKRYEETKNLYDNVILTKVLEEKGGD